MTLCAVLHHSTHVRSTGRWPQRAGRTPWMATWALFPLFVAVEHQPSHAARARRARGRRARRHAARWRPRRQRGHQWPQYSSWMKVSCTLPLADPCAHSRISFFAPAVPLAYGAFTFLTLSSQPRVNSPCHALTCSRKRAGRWESHQLHAVCHHAPLPDVLIADVVTAYKMDAIFFMRDPRPVCQSACTD